MELSKERGKAIDRLRTIVENERASAKIRTILEEDLSAESWQTDADDIRGKADPLREKIAELESEADALEDAASTVESVVDRVGAALEAVEEWEGAEGRDEKQDARETLFGNLQELIDAYDEVETLEVVEPADDEEGAVFVGRVQWDGEKWLIFDTEGFDIVPPEEGTENIWVADSRPQAYG